MRLQVRILTSNFAIFSKIFQTLRVLAWPLHFQRTRAIEGPFLSKRGVSVLSVHIFVIHVLLRALCKNWLLKLCFYLVKMVQNCSGHQILNFPSSFWFIFSLFWMLKKIMVAIYTLNFPLKPKNHKSEKYFVLPLAPLC